MDRPTSQELLAFAQRAGAIADASIDQGTAVCREFVKKTPLAVTAALLLMLEEESMRRGGDPAKQACATLARLGLVMALRSCATELADLMEEEMNQ